MLIYFGYTGCRDTCPVDAQNISAAIDLLGPAGDDVVPVFITIDPERDTPERLRMFLSAFHPRFVGLTGTVAETDEVAAAYRVEYERMNEDAPDVYDISHPGLMYLMGRQGEFLTLFPPLSEPEAMADEIRKHL